MSRASSGRVNGVTKAETARAHTDKAYEAELTSLRERLLEMGGMVEHAIAAATRAVVERDTGLAEQVKARDVEVNRLEVEIDGACRRILALRQPAASDLRFITTALKIVTDLERMGDLESTSPSAPSSSRRRRRSAPCTTSRPWRACRSASCAARSTRS